MKQELKEVEINGILYVPKDSQKGEAEKLEGMKYVIIRTYSAGVFAGYLKRQDGKEVDLVNARRLWYWDGAASLSQLAMEGVKKAVTCKFPCEVSKITLTESIEIIDCTEEARISIKGVPIWKQ
jgi:hypothetical protein